MPQIKTTATMTEAPRTIEDVNRDQAREMEQAIGPIPEANGTPTTTPVITEATTATDDVVQSVGATEAKPAKKTAKKDKPAKATKAATTTTKAAKATAATETNGKAPRTRSTGDSGKTTGERRLLVIKALRKAKATSATAGMTADQLAAKTGLTRFDVYGQLYHTHHLQTSGLVEQANVEGVRGLSYYLTAKGVTADDAAVTGAAKA